MTWPRSISTHIHTTHDRHTYLYCVRLALENSTGMQPATRESKRDFRVSESPSGAHTQEHTQTHMKIGRLSGVAYG
jgi:hypothetical protein